MKRAFVASVGTIIGIVLILSFKTNAPKVSGGGAISLGSANPGGSSPPTTPNSAAPISPPTATTPSTAARAKPATTPNAPTAPAATRHPANATYVGGTAQTAYGPVQIEIKVQSGKVTNVSAVQLPSGSGRDAEINAFAVPILEKETLTAQSANINAVSGASYTSAGYLQSLQSALDKAKT